MQVGAFEAKNTLGALLDRVEHGEKIVITRHGLTRYDAADLELARRADLPLATLDDDLRAAALAESVPLPGGGQLTPDIFDAP